MDGMRTSALLIVLVWPLMAQESGRSSHWGAGGQMPAVKKQPDAHQRMLLKYDINKDGKLDAAEREVMRKDRKPPCS